ncbi:MAG: hypothetical protein FJW69_09630 [Actinobacteria bacterium]|nr:hypothetical protein [Actinomycetota bacterium]
MYIAELKNKIPLNLEKMEDVLTSDVFSFFKYSERTVYLKSLLKKLNIAVSDNEINEAEFIFWPVYEDGTEPDLVILIGKYYLLFEAKFFSDFGKRTSSLKHLISDNQLLREPTEYSERAENIEKILEAQLKREATEGSRAAKKLNKHFIMIPITADYYYKPDRFKILKDLKINFQWINWQTIAEMLLKLIEEKQETLPDFLFATDLYQLLDKKQLRAFRSFNVLKDIFKSKLPDNIFFSLETTKYRGNFVGFLKSFLNFPVIIKAPECIFFNHKF